MSTAHASPLLDLALSPSGRLRLAAVDSGPLVEPARLARLTQAFERGSGDGLVELAGAELEGELPPALGWFRDFAHRFFSALCSLPDLDLPGALKEPPPSPEFDELARSAAPMLGGEYLNAELLESLWESIWGALSARAAERRESVLEVVRGLNPVWQGVGRVVFHLAENKRDSEHPFAFLATYTRRLSRAAKAQHVPLAEAVRDSGGAQQRQALLAVLAPVQRAAEKSQFVRELVDSGDLYHPLAWTPAEAYRFLREMPAIEQSGVLVRVPDWWSSRHRARAVVQVSVGKKPPSTVGLDALLDFSVEVALDGDKLSPEEWRAITRAEAGLAMVRGRWVEIDPKRLTEALDHWENVAKNAKDGMSLLEAMRLLAGATGSDGRDPQTTDGSATWIGVQAGEWLTETLRSLRSPETDAPSDPRDGLRAELRPYQRAGVEWLRLVVGLGLGACLADDMGLGKTVQVLGLLLRDRREAKKATRRPSLLVVPASLIGNWQAEIARFAPTLGVRVAHASVTPPEEVKLALGRAPTEIDLVITSYGGAQRLDWLAERDWHFLILDEAQAIKNPGARQTRAVKALKADARIALTGTPIENRLGDLWSLFDFLNPGLLGSGKAFSQLTKRLAGSPGGYTPLRELVRPYILRRLKTDPKVITDLPPKTELTAFAGLTRAQATLYAQAVQELERDLERSDAMARRGLVLASLLRLKQICNHPSQWLADGDYAEKSSGKLVRLRELCEPIAERQERVLVFTQFRELCAPLANFLQGVFGRAGLILHGGTAVKARSKLVEQFQAVDGPPFFVLSLKAGGTGLNLTAASHVIHFDRWWNPAVENQATDRAFRIGQKRAVMVHKLVCRGTVEQRIDELIESKRALSSELLEAGAEVALTELSDAELMRVVSLDLTSALVDDGA
ncbi:MAG TPA: DEAD/DEAH box helicase [Polyangiaceae bacterium]|nr:DEAD/DEAH box helicase [Polyangiaceae bacterium]